MLNPDISNANTSLKTSSNDLLNKSEICLFNYTKLKNRLNLTLSQNNSFNYDFSINDQNELKNRFKSPIIESNKSRYIKNVNINIPSSEKLLKEDFKNDFINNYDDSFAKYCGLNKEQFSEIYINNKFIPTANEFGDINISIKNIANILENYSHTKKLKITRKMRRRKKKKLARINLAPNKYKKLFKINKIITEKEENDIKKEKLKEELSKNDEDNDKNESKNDFENIPPLINSKNDNKNSNNINENQKSKTLLNIKKNLKSIIIPDTDKSQISIKENDNNKQNIDSEKINNNNISKNNDNNNKEIISGNIKEIPSNIKENILSNQSFKQILKSSNSFNTNNIFNFPPNIIQNDFKSPINKSAYEIFGRQAITPFNKSNNSLNMSLNNNLNNNTPSNRPRLSPMNFNPGDNIDNILSPIFYEYSKDKISSPFFVNASPFNNKNFNDHFIFNNNISFFFGNNSENNNDNNSEDNFNNQKKNQINNDINQNVNNLNVEKIDNNINNESNHINKKRED